MRMYRLGDHINADGWPFLFEGQAYLADGVPLTEYDDEGRVVLARSALSTIEKVCSNGRLTLADQRNGVEALARALNKGESVRASILLLQLQINSAASIAKYNPFHKPAGLGGGQFTHNLLGGGAIKPIEWSLHVEHNSTFVPDPNHPEFTIVHALVMTIVQKAILEVTTPLFRPGSPGYGRRLHDVVAAQIDALGNPGLYANPVYIEREPFCGKGIPAGASVPDIVYVSPGAPPLVFEIKTGRAVDTSSKDVTDQRQQALRNLPFGTHYEYVQIYDGGN